LQSVHEELDFCALKEMKYLFCLVILTGCFHQSDSHIDYQHDSSQDKPVTKHVLPHEHIPRYYGGQE